MKHDLTGSTQSFIRSPETTIRWNLKNRNQSNRLLLKLAFLIALIAPFLNISSNASETDDRIEASARDSYVFKKYLTNDSIDIKSSDGVVTLTGVVSDASKMTLTEQTVDSLPGVKSVKNALTIKPEGRTEQADDLIGMKINFLLLLHPNVNAETTNVTVNEGVVTLRGEALSLAQKELTTEYAEDVVGVKKIENQMTIAASSAEATETFGEKIDDASITAQIKTSLLWHRSTSSVHTNVRTKDGAVTISGVARNEAEKILISKISRDIHGVSTVRNEMTVEDADLSDLR